MHLKFKKLNSAAKLPAYATKNASGMDLYACLEKDEVIPAGASAIIPTGISVKLPENLEAQVRGHAGLAFRYALFCFPDTIDADTDGEIKVLLTNQSKRDLIIRDGMAVAQLVVNAAVVVCKPEFEGEEQVPEKKVAPVEYVVPPHFRKGALDQSEIMDNLLNAGSGK